MLSENHKSVEIIEGYTLCSHSVCVHGGNKKQSGLCCSHSVTIAGMLAEPVRLLHNLYENIPLQNEGLNFSVYEFVLFVN